MKVRIEGDWPGSVTLQRGWARAVARPWNEDTPMAHLRVERGGTGFLEECAAALLGFPGVTGVLSPPLLRAARPPWEQAGFRPHARLVLMRRELDGLPASGHLVMPGDLRDLGDAASRGPGGLRLVLALRPHRVARGRERHRPPRHPPGAPSRGRPGRLRHHRAGRDARLPATTGGGPRLAGAGHRPLPGAHRRRLGEGAGGLGPASQHPGGEGVRRRPLHLRGLPHVTRDLAVLERRA